jgi:hypothetical protein
MKLLNSMLGKKSAAGMTEEQRTERAKNAAESRWNKDDKE